ncbi:MAG: sulfate adenylyltransferase, partial [Bacteroidota bacterium]
KFHSGVTWGLEADLNLNNEIDDGDMLVKENDLPSMGKEFTATVSWMDNAPLTPGAKYVIQHGVNKVLAKVDSIVHKIHPDYSGIDTEAKSLGMNDIAQVRFRLNKPIFYDAFKAHRTNGSFILIDARTNTTSGAGFIS